MVKMILIWVILSVAIGFGIAAWRALGGKEQWKLTKYVAYATMCSLVAIALLNLFVILF